MLMRPSPFREFDRLAEQVLGVTGTMARPAAMAMDAWREDDTFVVELDLPGVRTESIDVDVERNMVTVKAERGVEDNREMIAAERPRGVFSRQLFLGDNLDTQHIEACYDNGVLSLRIPVAERAKPRRVTVASRNGDRRAINA